MLEQDRTSKLVCMNCDRYVMLAIPVKAKVNGYYKELDLCLACLRKASKDPEYLRASIELGLVKYLVGWKE